MTETYTIPLSSLHAKAAVRPDGYVARVLAAATAVTADTYTLDRATYDALRREYDPAAVAAERTTFRRLWAAAFAEPDPTPGWWASLLDDLPCGDCRGNTLAYAGRVPPPWREQLAFRAWLVGLFNEIRGRQGRPPIDAAEAELRWPIGGGSTGR